MNDWRQHLQIVKESDTYEEYLFNCGKVTGNPPDKLSESAFNFYKNMLYIEVSECDPTTTNTL